MRYEDTILKQDFAAIEAAVLQTERGRWFLGEFERRTRREHNELILSIVRELRRVTREDDDPDAVADASANGPFDKTAVVVLKHLEESIVAMLNSDHKGVTLNGPAPSAGVVRVEGSKVRKIGEG